MAAATAKPLFTPTTGAANATAASLPPISPTVNAVNALPIPPTASAASAVVTASAAFTVLSLNGFTAINQATGVPVQSPLPSVLAAAAKAAAINIAIMWALCLLLHIWGLFL